MPPQRAGKERKDMLELKFVIPEMEGTFGTLEFAGAGKAVTQRVNGVSKVVGRTYHLFSSVQRADDVEVILPGSVAEKHFEYEEPVVLINPRITVEGYAIGERGYSNYIMYADDMVTPQAVKSNK